MIIEGKIQCVLLEMKTEKYAPVVMMESFHGRRSEELLHVTLRFVLSFEFIYIFGHVAKFMVRGNRPKISGT
jgi:hypothetical protein